MTDIDISPEFPGYKPSGHYVYLHKRKTDGKILYVGKGQRYRFRSAYCRSRWWQSVARKHGVIAVVVKEFEQEVCAFTYEKILIGVIGRDKLVNICGGGEGASGLVMSDETKRKIGEAKIGEANRGRPKTKETIEKQRTAMLGFKHSEETKEKIRALSAEAVKKRPPNYGELISISKRHKDTYSFAHNDGREFTGTKFDYMRQQALLL